ncbi:MAG: pilin [Weeksellaceae bacterium]
MKYLLIIALVFTALFTPPTVSATEICTLERCAECNQCGYCIGKEIPGNLSACMACLYPSLPHDVNGAKTSLLIDPQTNRPAMKPAPGKYYTQLGCVSTNVASFTDPSAAGGVLNFILTRLIFPTVGVVAFLYLIYGSFQLMTAQGNREQIGNGKRMVVGAIVGLIFTLSAVLIVNFVGGQILKLPGFN